MPIEYKLERDGAIVLAHATGVITLDCFMSMQKEMNADNELQTPHDTLLDVTSVTDIQVSVEDLTTIAESLTAGPKTLGANKLAIVARQEQAFVLGNIYGTTDKGVEETVIMFFHAEVARHWLGID